MLVLTPSAIPTTRPHDIVVIAHDDGIATPGLDSSPAVRRRGRGAAVAANVIWRCGPAVARRLTHQHRKSRGLSDLCRRTSAFQLVRHIVRPRRQGYSCSLGSDATTRCRRSVSVHPQSDDLSRSDDVGRRGILLRFRCTGRLEWIVRCRQSRLLPYIGGTRTGEEVRKRLRRLQTSRTSMASANREIGAPSALSDVAADFFS